MSLRGRLLAGMAVIGIVLAVAGFAIVRTTERHLVAQVDDQLRSAGPPFRATVVERLGAPPEAQSSAFSDLYVGAVTTAGLQPVLRPNLYGDDLPLPPLEVEQVLAGAARGRPFTVETDGGVRFRVLASVEPRTGTVVAAALPLDDVASAVSRLRWVAVIAVTVTVTVLGLVTFWVLRLGVHPVKRMTAAATGIAAGDLSRRVPEAAPGTEAAELGTALNTMLGRIEAAFDERAKSEERLRRFVADASHELRTPVTTIRGYAELYRNGGLGEGEALDEAMRRTEEEAVRMARLVDDLLLLARLDQGRPLEEAPVDLARIVADAAADARAVDPSRPVEAHHPTAVPARGDEGRLRQVVANLVGNALVHTPPGTPIRLAAGTDGPVRWIEVHDDGPGMPAEVAERAFERFFRGDPSRSRHRGGSGLGLAIVRATAEAHGGTVRLASEPGSGTTVRLELRWEHLELPGE